MQQRDAGRRACLEQSSTWLQFLHDSAPAIDSYLIQADSHNPDLIPELHQIASKVYKSCFPWSALPDNPAFGWTGTLPHYGQVEAPRKMQIACVADTPQCLAFLVSLGTFSSSQTITQEALLLRLENRPLRPSLNRLRLQQIIMIPFSSSGLSIVLHLRCPSVDCSYEMFMVTLRQPMEERAILHAFVAKTWNGPPTVAQMFSSCHRIAIWTRRTFESPAQDPNCTCGRSTFHARLDLAHTCRPDHASLVSHSARNLGPALSLRCQHAGRTHGS